MAYDVNNRPFAAPIAGPPLGLPTRTFGELWHAIVANEDRDWPGWRSDSVFGDAVYMSNGLGGEVGELCGCAKKMVGGGTGNKPAPSHADFDEEGADVLHYVIYLLTQRGVSFTEFERKFAARVAVKIGRDTDHPAADTIAAMSFSGAVAEYAAYWTHHRLGFQRRLIALTHEMLPVVGRIALTAQDIALEMDTAGNTEEANRTARTFALPLCVDLVLILVETYLLRYETNHYAAFCLALDRKVRLNEERMKARRTAPASGREIRLGT